MARIAVARASFENGAFPPVCAASGVHTDDVASWRFGKGLVGRLPMSNAAQRRARRIRRTVWVFGLLAAAAAIGGGIIESTGLIAIGCVLAIAWGICVALTIAWTPNARQRGTDAVELMHVHEKFVGTIQAAWAQRPPEPSGDSAAGD